MSRAVRFLEGSLDIDLLKGGGVWSLNWMRSLVDKLFDG